MSYARFRAGLTRAPALALFLIGLGVAADTYSQDTGITGNWPDEKACQTREFDDPNLAAWCIAIDSTKGNCIACHAFNVSPWPPGLPTAGNIAPPIVAMQGRFPDRISLEAVVADATTVNPRTSMPPYLRHGILSRQQIELLVDFMLTL